MWSKIGNGVAGTWGSLDERERALAMVAIIYGALALYLVLTHQGRALKKREMLREENRELADMIAERMRK